MKLTRLFQDKTVLSIDPATHSIAYSVMEHYDDDAVLRAHGKLSLKGCSVSQKFDRINAAVPFLADVFQPTLIVIEQPIYIQNFQTSRGISYVVGYTWGRFCQERIPVVDVVPLKWKSGIGYQNVSANEKKAWGKTMTESEVKKKAEFERKNRVRNIIKEIFPIDHIQDNDIVDAIGIGYWAVKTL